MVSLLKRGKRTKSLPEGEKSLIPGRTFLRKRKGQKLCQPEKYKGRLTGGASMDSSEKKRILRMRKGSLFSGAKLFLFVTKNSGVKKTPDARKLAEGRKGEYESLN